jgi:hypothetical protein
MKRVTHHIKLVAAVATMLLGVACTTPEEPTPKPKPLGTYGYFYLGEEEVPVVSYSTVEDGHFLLKLSPLEDVRSATTYAIVGVNTAFIGTEIDVTTKYHNDDYIFVYEDPTRYYAPYRQLQSGTIMLDKNGAGMVRAKVDIVLSDGTPFSYEQILLAK